MRSIIFNLVDSLAPIDSLEQEHKEFTLQWIKSGADLFRIQKPDIPKIHLVSYCLALNPDYNRVLLGHHKIADLWLPSGGHVDKDEHPQDAAKRECLEELKIKAHFLQEDPLFLTVTDVHVNTQKHTDVSLWFIIEGDDQNQVNFCRNEYHRMEWFAFDKIPFEKSDIHIRRFMRKLEFSFKKVNGKPSLPCFP